MKSMSSAEKEVYKVQLLQDELLQEAHNVPMIFFSILWTRPKKCNWNMNVNMIRCCIWGKKYATNVICNYASLSHQLCFQLSYLYSLSDIAHYKHTVGII